MTLRRLLPAAVAPLTVVLALAGAACTKTTSEVDTGQGPTSTVASDGGAPAAVPVGYLARTASDTCARATSGHVRSTVSASGSATAAGTLDGVFDTSTKQASFQADLTQFDLGGRLADNALVQRFKDALGGPVQVVVQGDTVYVQWSFLNSMLGVDTPWASFTGNEASSGVGALLPSVSGDACDPVDLLRQSSDDVTVVGSESVDGVDTTHYRADVDPAKVTEGKGMTRGLAGSSTVTVDVWVDNDGLVRQVEVRADRGTGEQTVTARFELTDVNEPVTVTVPDADQVTPVDPGAKLFGLGSN